MYLFTAILFVLLTHLQLIGGLMMGGALVAAVVMFLTRPNPQRPASLTRAEEPMVDDEEHTDREYEYPQAA